MHTGKQSNNTENFKVKFFNPNSGDSTVRALTDMLIEIFHADAEVCVIFK